MAVVPSNVRAQLADKQPHQAFPGQVGKQMELVDPL